MIDLRIAVHIFVNVALSSWRALRKQPGYLRNMFCRSGLCKQCGSELIRRHGNERNSTAIRKDDCRTIVSLTFRLDDQRKAQEVLDQGRRLVCATHKPDGAYGFVPPPQRT